jgi:hypothetical protein
LFFAIAIGLGMGADQRIPTLAAFGIIMGYLLIRLLLGKKITLRSGNSLYLNVNFHSLEEKASGVFDKLNSVLINNFNEVDLHRMDVEGAETQFVFYLHAESPESLVRFTNEIQEMYPQIKISIVEQRNLIGG